MNLLRSSGIFEITGPYLAELSYNSNKGTANSLRLRGTAKKPERGRGVREGRESERERERREREGEREGVRGER